MDLTTFFIPARNCCPIEECNEQCLMLGHPTWLGVLIIISVAVIIAIMPRILKETKKAEEE